MGWHFRFSLRKLPPKEDWTRYRVSRNPVLKETPGVYRPTWLAALFDGMATLPPELPRPGEDGAPVLAGVAPEGEPVVVPVVGDFAVIYAMASSRPTLAEVVAATSAEAVDSALRARGIACVWEDDWPVGA